jgi:UDP-glucose 4-epimerase
VRRGRPAVQQVGHLCGHTVGGHSEQVLNCGYGRGFSVLDVINSVKSAANKTFPVRMGPRRPGDPAVLVASAERIGEVLDWSPRHDDLDTIVTHALAWVTPPNRAPS